MAFDSTSLLEFLQFMIIVLFVLIVLIPVVYVTFRAASLGWYRSRFEHFKKMLNHQEGDDQ